MDRATGFYPVGWGFESLRAHDAAELQFNVYTAAAGTPFADALAMLGSWAASQTDLASEAAVTR